MNLNPNPNPNSRTKPHKIPHPGGKMNTRGSCLRSFAAIRTLPRGLIITSISTTTAAAAAATIAGPGRTQGLDAPRPSTTSASTTTSSVSPTSPNVVS